MYLVFAILIKLRHIGIVNTNSGAPIHRAAYTGCDLRVSMCLAGAPDETVPTGQIAAEQGANDGRELWGKPMFRIALPADRAEPDMAAVARAFGLSVNDMMDNVRIGTISRWFELGNGNKHHRPHQVFASCELGIRVDVDVHGDVDSISKYEVASASLHPHRTGLRDPGHGKDRMEIALHPTNRIDPDTAHKARLDALLDEALEESFPASDPIAISFETPDRNVHPSTRRADNMQGHHQRARKWTGVHHGRAF